MPSSPQRSFGLSSLLLLATAAFTSLAVGLGCDEVPPLGPPTTASSGSGGSSIPCTDATAVEACGPSTDCLSATCGAGDTCTYATSKKGTLCDDGATGATVCDGKGLCVPPSCLDGEKGAAETDVDCGGPCGPCPDGDVCAKNADCDGGYCGPSEAIGVTVCQPCSQHDDCNADRHCDPATKRCIADKTSGATCDARAECVGDACVDGFCCDTACDDGCSACSVARGAMKDGVCEPYVFKGMDVPGACDDTSGNCGEGLRCTCDAAGFCNAKLGVLSVISGGRHSCALFTTGQVKCWGANDAGQLGLGDVQSRGDMPGEMGTALPFVDLGAGSRATALVLGARHTCVRLDTGKVKCWGANDAGQLGLGDLLSRGDAPGEMGDVLPAVDLGPGVSVVALAAGEDHTCARLDDGSLKCWGANDAGQLGLGDAQSRGDAPGEMGAALEAVDLGPAVKLVSLALGARHACAALSSGAVKCWGANESGQLGLGDVAARGALPGDLGNALPAVDLGVGKKAKSVVAFGSSSCARLDDASVKCWGKNHLGQLGLGDVMNRGDTPGELGDALPTVPFGIVATLETLVASGDHACALLTSGALKCWGANAAGQLGLGDTTPRGSAPGQMGDALAAIELGKGRRPLVVAPGADHTCARLDDGTVKCWGANAAGQLGLGDTAPRGDGPNEMGDVLAPTPLFE
jgi:alpha-tubulin suppressor-like RCC1 family protein